MQKTTIRLSYILIIAAALSDSTFTSRAAHGQVPVEPIRILIDVHADPMAPSVAIQQQQYQDWVDTSNWVLDIADKYGAKISFLSTGEFMEWVLGDPAQGYPLMQRFYASGNQIGTHTHTKMRISTHHWQDIGYTPPTPLMIKSWDDHVGVINTVITNALGITDPIAIAAINCNRGAHIPSDNAQRLQMMSDYGFTIHEQGPDQEFYTYFNHYAMNPYRPSGISMLEHDPNGQIVLAPTGSILGLNDVHFGIIQDNRMVAKQGRFLLELLNWLHDIHVAGTQRVWTCGWGSHCHDYMPGTPTNSELDPMLAWFSQHFIGQSVGGHVAASFSNFVDARDAYLVWEKTHPSEISFSYSANTTDWNQYPYLQPAVTYLTEALYDIAMPAVGTVRWHRVIASVAAGGPYNTYVAYTIDGVPTTVDLSTDLGAGFIATVRPDTGIVQIVSTEAVPIETIGTILVPTDQIITVLGDLNADGVVNTQDLLTVIAQWGPCAPSLPCEADIDNDGAVNVSDLLILIGNWS